MTDMRRGTAPNFDRHPAKHVVIERIADGVWQERARFAEVTDADDYVLWRLKHYGTIFAAVGFEAMVVTEPTDIIGPATTVDPPANDAENPTDQRTSTSWPPFDA